MGAQVGCMILNRHEFNFRYHKLLREQRKRFSQKPSEWRGKPTLASSWVCVFAQVRSGRIERLEKRSHSSIFAIDSRKRHDRPSSRPTSG
jgi:hypothetical protein